ncbi:RagB/SusD family nutrient uptake outer membrane protein [Maribacter polysaccharolyticus]|uniref:RagB/SusD family nutrient uptake outer membrane protein n=1 Tax=Maribacter polysaccharolyticus TaxID=3020831 RepID=UPI00237F9A22|nr:RagB/SusD family nutrient uptake outer membrane protein [Maribacter polysaccharolyticus]MDE3741653.1 RagB/SusD family nutrient uptake outer membrane protein [Maribacter polysaccharolyticus]
MKKYNKILLLIMIGFFLSCSESFLEVSPQDSVSNDEALTSLEDLETSISGVYDEFQGAYYYGRYMLLIPDVMADDVKQNEQANRVVDFAQHVVSVDDSQASALWTGLYYTNNALNNIINSDIEVTESTQDEKDHIMGEAYALRGLIYFDLVRLFANHYTYTADASHLGVPIILDFDYTLEPERNTVEEVYDQVISDMTTALTLIDDTSRTGNSNSLSSTAVKALLSRVYLYKEDWSNAEAMATEVIEAGYSLVDNADYLTLWSEDNSSESIFEISQTESDNQGGNCLGAMYVVDGYGDYLPSDDVVSLYDADDARLQVFIEDELLAGDYAPYRMNKYPDVLGYDNTKVIRLAEVYLIRAEARAQLGTDIAGAQEDLDMVRQRALPTAANVTATGDELLEEIMLERRLELCFEGHRLWDLMRYKEDIVRNECTASICYIPYGDDTNILPIPQDETDVNPNITPNPGY